MPEAGPSTGGGELTGSDTLPYTDPHQPGRGPMGGGPTMSSRATGSLLLLLLPLALLPSPVRPVASGLEEGLRDTAPPAGDYELAPTPDTPEDRLAARAAARNWPSFRGPNASGVADGRRPPTTWDAP